MYECGQGGEEMQKQGVSSHVWQHQPAPGLVDKCRRGGRASARAGRVCGV
jgi:hypothetical protein